MKYRRFTKTQHFFFHLKGWFPATRFQREGWLRSNWCLGPGQSCNLTSIPGVREAGSQHRYRHWRSGQSFSRAGADTNSKNKLLISSGWLLNVSQNMYAYHANSNKRQKGLKINWISCNLIFMNTENICSCPCESRWHCQSSSKWTPVPYLEICHLQYRSQEQGGKESRTLNIYSVY